MESQNLYGTVVDVLGKHFSFATLQVKENKFVNVDEAEFSVVGINHQDKIVVKRGDLYLTEEGTLAFDETARDQLPVKARSRQQIQVVTARPGQKLWSPRGGTLKIKSLDGVVSICIGKFRIGDSTYDDVIASFKESDIQKMNLVKFRYTGFDQEFGEVSEGSILLQFKDAVEFKLADRDAKGYPVVQDASGIGDDPEKHQSVLREILACAELAVAPTGASAAIKVYAKVDSAKVEDWARDASEEAMALMEQEQVVLEDMNILIPLDYVKPQIANSVEWFLDCREYAVHEGRFVLPARQTQMGRLDLGAFQVYMGRQFKKNKSAVRHGSRVEIS
jgi:hypothetical protein